MIYRFKVKTFVLLWFCLCQWVAAGDRVWFRFEAEASGGQGYEKYGVEIRGSGETRVSRFLLKEELPVYRTMLSGDKMMFVKTLVLSVDFFGLPEKVDEPKWSHPVRMRLMVELEGKSRTLEYMNVHRPELKPVATLVARLVAQPEAQATLENGGSPSFSLRPNGVGGGVFQTSLFKEPLKAKIKVTEGGQELVKNLENLAWITPPEEFVGFYASEVKRRGIYVRVGVIPENHKKALLPFYLMFLREMDAWKGELQQSDLTVRHQLAFKFGAERYRPALSYLTEQLDQLEKKDGPFFDVIVRFGLVGVEAVIPFLKHEKALVRETAVGLVESALGYNPSKWNLMVGISKEEYGKVAALIQSKAIPRLREMALSSGDGANYLYVSRVLSGVEKELARQRQAKLAE